MFLELAKGFVYLFLQKTISRVIMVNPKKDYELLMQYLQGSPLKKHAASVPDPAFKQDWQPSAQAKRQPVYTLNEQPKPTARTKPFTVKPYGKKRHFRLLIAGVALIVFIILFSKAYSFYTLTPEKLYTQLYEPFQITEEAQPAAKNSIQAYYKAGNFVAATLQGKKQAQLSDKERFLVGLAYLQRADYNGSIKWLEPVAHNFKNPYRQAGEYYLSLAYLRNGDYDRSIETMERIHYAPAHAYKNHITQDVIQDIKMLKWK